MKMTGALIGAAVLVFAMAGCSAQSSADTTSATSQAIASAPSSAAATPESTTDAKDAAFLAKVHAVSPEITYSDPELIAYGEIACAQLQSGSKNGDIVVISGDGFETANQNLTVVGSARENLCP